MRGVVHREADTDDEQHAAGRVDGESPKVHEAHHVDQREHDGDEDENGTGHICQHEDHNEEDADEGEGDAAD